jgi:hypothetical protein
MRSTFAALSLLALAAAACGGASQAPPGGGSPNDAAPSLIANPSIALPADATPNDNGPIGPFCCTGSTATVRSPDGQALGYVYFFNFPGGGFQTSPTTSYAATLGVMISGVQNINDPSSPQVQSEVDFSGASLSQGASRSAQAGALLYLVTITHVDVEAINGESCFNMGTITAEVEVSVAP